MASSPYPRRRIPSFLPMVVKLVCMCVCVCARACPCVNGSRRTSRGAGPRRACACGERSGNESEREAATREVEGEGEGEGGNVRCGYNSAANSAAGTRCAPRPHTSASASRKITLQCKVSLWQLLHSVKVIACMCVRSCVHCPLNTHLCCGYLSVQLLTKSCMSCLHGPQLLMYGPKKL